MFRNYREDLRLFLNRAIDMRYVITDSISVNPICGEGDPDHTNTAIKNVSMVHAISYEMTGDWDEAGLLLIPKNGEQQVIARGDIQGRRGVIKNLDIPAAGSIKVRTYTRQGAKARIFAVLLVSGIDDPRYRNWEFGAAAVGVRTPD